MLSSASQRVVLLRAVKRRVPNRYHGIHFRQQLNGSLAAFSSYPSFPSNNTRRDSKDATTKALEGLPTIHPWRGRKSALLSTSSVLERAYPLGLGKGSTVLWFSTTTKDEEEEKSSLRDRAGEYRERASAYGERARDGAKSFGGMMQRYGPAFVGTYLSVYVANLALFYVGIESGAMDPMTILGYISGNHEEVRSSAEVVSEMLEHYTVTAPFAEVVKAKPHLANFAIAWISTKFTEPIRFGTTVAVVPRVARYFGVVPDDKIDQEGDADKSDLNEQAKEGSDDKTKIEKIEDDTKTEEKKV